MHLEGHRKQAEGGAFRCLVAGVEEPLGMKIFDPWTWMRMNLGSFSY